MAETSEVGADSGTIRRRDAWRLRAGRWRARLRPAVPFALGIVAAFLGLLIYNVLNPPAQPMTVTQVNTAVAQAMASATPPPAFSADVYRAVQPSLVLIQTNGRGLGSGIAEGDKTTGLGSGVVITDQGAILTALHVVDGASSIQVTFADGTESSAKVVSKQPQNDIAVIQPDKTPETIVPAVMGNPGALRVGDEAYAFGNPFGLYGSLTTGVISGLHREYQAPNGRNMQDLIQIDSAVNPGNSGGPLLNRAGQVVGIVVSLLNPTDQEFFIGIGFAVPITTAAGVAGAPQY